MEKVVCAVHEAGSSRRMARSRSSSWLASRTTSASPLSRDTPETGTGNLRHTQLHDTTTPRPCQSPRSQTPLLRHRQCCHEVISPRTCRDARDTLRAALSYATTEDELISRNVAVSCPAFSGQGILLLFTRLPAFPTARP